MQRHHKPAPAPRRSQAPFFIGVAVVAVCIAAVFAVMQADRIASHDRHVDDVRRLQSIEAAEKRFDLLAEASQKRKKLDLNEWKSWCSEKGLTLCQACSGDGWVVGPKATSVCATCIGSGLK